MYVYPKKHSHQEGKKMSNLSWQEKSKGLQCFHPWLLLPYRVPQEDT